MSKSTAIATLSGEPSPSKLACGRLAAITENGEPLVEIRGLERLIKVRTAIAFQSEREARQLIDEEVLLCFTDDDPVVGIIVGVVTESIWDRSRPPTPIKSENVMNAFVEAERIEFNAQQELVLRCGKGKIQIRKDGAVFVEGKKITSKSKGAHKIRGATVNIN